MKATCIRALLLATFVFWASGVAQFVHVQIEHQGIAPSLMSADDDQDDDAPTAPTSSAHVPTGMAPRQRDPNQQSPATTPAKRPCILCQLLSAMLADRVPPIALPRPDTRLVALVSWTVESSFRAVAPLNRQARAPPIAFS